MNMHDISPIRPARDVLASLPAYLRQTAILAGGALRACFDGTQVKDYDLFFRTNDQYDHAVNVLNVNTRYLKCPDAGRTKVYVDMETGVQINLVGFAWGSPEETVDRFDFRCCRMALWLEYGVVPTFLARPGAIEDAQSKTLTVMLSNGEDRTVRRIEHYEQDYGYTAVIGDTEVESDDFIPGHDVFLIHPPVPREERVRRYIRSLPQRDGGY